MSGSDDFFQQRKEQSRVKTEIVRKYFGAWAGIMLSVLSRDEQRRDKRIAYLDFFAGQGYYEDGNPSTPIVLLEMVIRDVRLREHLVTLFNDRDPECVKRLEKAIRELHGIETLSYKPNVTCDEVDESIARLFQEKRLIPSLAFLDPYGYKGLSLDLISALLKDWGCDCIIFFNYNRIRAALNNELTEDEMVALFSLEALKRLKTSLPGLSPVEAEAQVIEEFSRSLMLSSSAQHILPFRFVDEKQKRTSHHIIFATKHFLGYDKMKHVMAKASSLEQQGVATFEYNPVAKHLAFQQPMLFEYSRPLEDLADMLLIEYQGRSISFGNLYTEHSVGRQYIVSNYRDVLLRLEHEERLSIQKHNKGTLASDKIITFPHLVSA